MNVLVQRLRTSVFLGRHRELTPAFFQNMPADLLWWIMLFFGPSARWRKIVATSSHPAVAQDRLVLAVGAVKNHPAQRKLRRWVRDIVEAAGPQERAKWAYVLARRQVAPWAWARRLTIKDRHLETALLLESEGKISKKNMLLIGKRAASAAKELVDLAAAARKPRLRKRGKR